VSRRKNALTLLVQKADAVARVVRRTFALTLCVWKKFALTLLARKVDAVAHVVRTTFALMGDAAGRYWTSSLL